VLTAAFRSEFLARQALTFVPSYETLAAAEDEPATAPIVVTPETLDSAPPESRD
ncbi:MAG: hypothetical protein GWO02_21740, partial [Gammaproteobacteria bacterium]|nr:hypothetical protein [Gammaproteobacteria bacterium]